MNRIKGLGFRAEGFGMLVVDCLGLRVQGIGFWDVGCGLVRVEGSGCAVFGCWLLLLLLDLGVWGRGPLKPTRVGGVGNPKR